MKEVESIELHRLLLVTLKTLNHEIAHHNGQGETSATRMGKIGDLAYNIGTSLNKEDINSQRQTITPTVQALKSLSTNEQLTAQQNNQALLWANEVQRLEGVEDGDGVWGYIPPGVNGEACTGVKCSDRQIIAQIEACKTDDTQCRDYPEHLKTLASFIIPATTEEVAIAVVTGGAGGYVIKAGGKVVSKVFKSKDEAQKALDKAQELAKSDIGDKVKENISNSQTARQSSGCGQFSQTADNISALKG